MAYTGWPNFSTLTSSNITDVISVATHLRCGGICCDSIITNFLLIHDSEII